MCERTHSRAANLCYFARVNADSPYAPLARPAFRAFLLGRVLAVLGSQVLSVAVGWQVYALTGDPLDLGLVGLVQFLPPLLLFPLAGVVVDRTDRARALSACYLGFLLAAGVLLALSAGGAATTGRIFAALVLLALARVFSGPSATALLPQIVPADEYPRATIWNSSGFTAATVLGPALGGGVYALAASLGRDGALWAYGLATLLFAAGAMAALTLPSRRAEHRGAPPGFREALDGLRFIARRPVLLGAITLDLFAVLFGGAVALLPIFARDVLAVGPEGLGLLRAAPAAGALITALWLAHYPVRRHNGRVLHVAVAIFGLATLGFAFSTDFWLSLLLLAITGAADEVSVFIRIQVVQLATPDRLRGRVSAAEYVFIGASNQLGELESGLTASWWGAVPAVAVGGAASLGVVALSALLAPALRDLDRVEDLRDSADDLDTGPRAGT